MEFQVLFSLRNNEKVFINVVCRSSDWRFKGYLKDFHEPGEVERRKDTNNDENYWFQDHAVQYLGYIFTGVVQIRYTSGQVKVQNLCKQIED